MVELATDNLAALPADWVYETFGAAQSASVYDRVWLVQSLAQLGRFAEAAEYEAEVVVGLAEPTQHAFTIGLAHFTAGTLHLLKGDWAKARSLNTENREGRRFSSKCAAPLAVVCASCGFTNDPGDEFCGGCAQSLRAGTQMPRKFQSPESYTPKHLAEKILTSKTALEGERKQVTVLFADLKGSMELLADRDPWPHSRSPGPALASLLPSFRLPWSSHEWKLYPARSASAKPKGETGVPTETRYQHVLVDDAGTPFIAGTTTKVVELVLDHLAYGWSPEELHFQHPGVTMAQIHSAFAYYWDHKAELDEDIERRAQRVEGLREAVRSVPAVARLRAFRRP